MCGSRAQCAVPGTTAGFQAASSFLFLHLTHAGLSSPLLSPNSVSCCHPTRPLDSTRTPPALKRLPSAAPRNHRRPP